MLRDLAWLYPSKSLVTREGRDVMRPQPDDAIIIGDVLSPVADGRPQTPISCLDGARDLLSHPRAVIGIVFRPAPSSVVAESV